MKKLDEILGTIAIHLKPGQDRPLNTNLRNRNSGDKDMGFNAKEMYETQSDWLKAADLNMQEHTLTISDISEAEVGGKMKLILHFAGKEKTLVLNKTNKDAIGYAYGEEDTDPWIGKTLILYPTKVDYQGKSVEAIRVRPVLEQAQGMDALQKHVDDDASDGIPF